MADQNANLEECFEDDPNIREPQIALLFEDTAGQLSKRWYMVGDNHLHGFKPVVINYLFHFEEADEEKIGALEAQFGPAQIIGLTYDMKPYNLGLQTLGSADMEHLKACIDEVVTPDYVADRFHEAHPGIDYEECMAQVRALTEAQFQTYKDGLLKHHAQPASEEELVQAVDEYYMMDPGTEKEVREQFLDQLAKDNRRNKRAIAKHRLAS